MIKKEQKTFLQIGDLKFLFWRKCKDYTLAFDVAENWGIYGWDVEAYGKGENTLYWTCREIIKKIHQVCYENEIKELKINLVWATDIVNSRKVLAKLGQLKGMIKGVFMSAGFEIKEIETFEYNENLALTYLYKYRPKNLQCLRGEAPIYYYHTKKESYLQAKFPNRPKKRDEKKLFTNLRYLEYNGIKDEDEIYTLTNQDLCDAWMIYAYHTKMFGPRYE